jgi:hypothetical protein
MSPAAQDNDYLKWSPQQAQTIGRSMRKSGYRKSWTFRGLHTERASNYKLRATWLTPEVIRASARLEQIRSRLSDDATKALIAEAEAAGDTVVMVEIDPDEGSGVIPLDWQAFLQPKRPQRRKYPGGWRNQYTQTARGTSTRRGGRARLHL